MAVALAEPQVPNNERAARRGNISHARERIKFKPNLQTEEQRAQFVDDFHTVITSSESANKDKENFAKVFKSQDKISKLYIGQILLEQLEDEVRNTQDEKSIRAFLQVAKLINLSKECTLDKQDRKDTEKLLKELHKFSAEHTAKLSLIQRGVLAAGAMGSIAGIPDLRQAVQPSAPTSTLDARTIPSFDLGIDWQGEEAGPRMPVPTLGSNIRQPTTTPESVAKQSIQERNHPTHKDMLEQEAQRLLPNAIRALENPELKRLYNLGCIDFKETDIAGKKVIILDYYETPGVECNLKFPQVYKMNRVENRMVLQSVGNNEKEILIKQVNMDCAIHAYAMATILAQREASPNSTPLLMNPLLYAELNRNLTPEKITQVVQEVSNSPEIRAQYPTSQITGMADSIAMNYGTLADQNIEKALFSAFGMRLNKYDNIPYATKKEGTNSYILKKDMFTEEEWKKLSNSFKINLPSEGSEVLVDQATANKLFGTWINRWYTETKQLGRQNSKAIIPLLSLNYYDNGIRHLFTVVGTTQRDGATYFTAMEGLQGEISKNLRDKGVRVKNGLVLIPSDRLVDLGAFAQTLSYDPKDKINRLYEESQIARNQNEREKITSDQIGFRVSEVESIKNLPPGTGVVRIAGNETIVDEKGNIIDKEYDVEGMLRAAKEKGVKVVFVYNPTWFPDQEGKPKTTEQLRKDEAKIRTKIRQQLNAILKYDNVWSVEIGNEVTENSPNSDHQFWKGDFESYLLQLKWTAEEADKIVKVQKATNPSRPETRLMASAFTFPEKHDREYRQMAATLNELSRRVSLPIDIALHAYDIKSLEWMLQNLPPIFGNREYILSETGTEILQRDSEGKLVQRSEGLQELEKMLNLVQQKNILALVHEYKSDPVLASLTEHTGRYYGLTNGDPRLNLIQGRLNRRVAELEGVNLPVASRAGVSGT